VTEFGGLCGAGGIGSLTQPLLGERIQASLKPNRVVVVASGESLNLLGERRTAAVDSERDEAKQLVLQHRKDRLLERAISQAEGRTGGDARGTAGP
jgi:hypothetical protein